MGFRGNYDSTVKKVLGKHKSLTCISYMFYAEPNERDMVILKAGIEDIYNGDYYIYAEEIGPETARLFDKTRGWILVFMFVNEVDGEMMEWIECGLSELRVKSTVLRCEEVKSDV